MCCGGPQSLISRWGFPELRIPFWGPYNEDYRVFALPYLWKLPDLPNRQPSVKTSNECLIGIRSKGISINYQSRSAKPAPIPAAA